MEAAPGWRIVPPAGPAAGTADAAAFHKIRAAEVLAEAAPGAEASLYLDPDRPLIGNPDTLLTRWLLPQDLAFWRHPASDWRDMAERHLLETAAPAAHPRPGRALRGGGDAARQRRLRHRHDLAPACGAGGRGADRGLVAELVGGAGGGRPRALSRVARPERHAGDPPGDPARPARDGGGQHLHRQGRAPAGPAAIREARGRRAPAAGRLSLRGGARASRPRRSCAAASSARWSRPPSPSATR